MRRVFIALLFVLSACSAEPPAPSPASVCESKGYTYGETGGCNFSQEGSSEQPRIQMNYPILIVQRSPLIESTVDAYITESRADFMQQFEEASRAEGEIWSYELRPAVYPHSDTVLSIHYTEVVDTGEDNPRIAFRSFTFDLAANQLLNFEDLFVEGSDPLAVITPLARDAIMVERFGMSTSGEVDPGTDDLNDFRNFALTDTYLILFFEPGQVALAYAGAIEVQIPLSDLEGILRDF
jgi:hypothetical protein